MPGLPLLGQMLPSTIAEDKNAYVDLEGRPIEVKSASAVLFGSKREASPEPRQQDSPPTDFLAASRMGSAETATEEGASAGFQDLKEDKASASPPLVPSISRQSSYSRPVPLNETQGTLGRFSKHLPIFNQIRQSVLLKAREGSSSQQGSKDPSGSLKQDSNTPLGQMTSPSSKNSSQQDDNPFHPSPLRGMEERTSMPSRFASISPIPTDHASASSSLFRAESMEPHPAAASPLPAMQANQTPAFKALLAQKLQSYNNRATHHQTSNAGSFEVNSDGQATSSAEVSNSSLPLMPGGSGSADRTQHSFSRSAFPTSRAFSLRAKSTSVSACETSFVWSCLIHRF
jgi:hypothetical protein